MTGAYALVPLVLASGGSLFVLLVDAFLDKERGRTAGYLTLIILAACGASCFLLWGRDYSFFSGNLVLDRHSLFVILFLVLGSSSVVLMSLKFSLSGNENKAAYFGLLLFALSGLMIMVTSGDLLTIFLGLETLSISSYALAGIDRQSERSSEAALKYFLLGSLASAFLVFGLAFLFGASGSLKIAAVADAFRSGPNFSAWCGLALVVIGLGFKMAFAPFHMWAPDVYQGAPMPVTAFFAFGPKTAGFIVLIKIFFDLRYTASLGTFLVPSLGVISGLTMVVGNLGALRQTNVKRLLAYSSIAHGGYLLMAIISGDGSGLVFYLLVYMFMILGAFAVLSAVGRLGGDRQTIADFAGLGASHPWLAAPFAILLLSLAGIPPTGGFLAKFLVFSSAAGQGHVVLVVTAVLTSLISVYYYLRLIVEMYMKDPSGQVTIDLSDPGVYVVVFFCLFAVSGLGTIPGKILTLIRQLF